MSRFAAGDRWVGAGEPCYIVAEISANHNRSFDRAAEIVKAAKEAGADAVKLQTYTPDTMTIDSDQDWFKIPGDSPLWAGRTLHQLYGEAYTPWDWQPKLQALAGDLGLGFFSTPFDESSIDFLETMNVPLYKVASFEVTDLALLRKIAQTGKPVIMSTGMASLGEIDEAVTVLRENGAVQVALLKCTSAYPASPSEMNLRTIPHLATTFNVVAGLSDHTLGSAVATGAVALGASIIEKHFTLRRSDGGPDSAFSMEPAEFTEMVGSIRTVEQALGRVSYARTHDEEANTRFRRSLFVVEDLKRGEPFTNESIRSIRPGHGLAPRYLEEILGKRAARDVKRGTPLAWDLVSSDGRA